MNIEENFPSRIKNFDRLESKINIFSPDVDVEKELEGVKLGDSKECLITYMNHLYQLILRVEGRGQEIKYKAIKLKLIYDEVGPIAGYNEKEKYIELKKLDEVIISFHEWLLKEIN